MSTKASQVKSPQRQRLLERSGGLCEICGKLPDWRGLSVHHIKNRGMGGSRHEYTDSELQILCGICHDKKTLYRE
jgi:5-methylcytosine-specific restriction endonuclease McrA